jgi:hypothetical protein
MSAAVEVAVPEWLAVRAGKDESRRRAKSVKMRAEVGHDEVREGDDASASAQLGRPEEVPATGRIVDLAGDTDVASGQVDVIRGKRGEIYERTEGRVSLQTRCDRVAEIIALIKQAHPCEVPGISARTITDGKCGG